MRCAHKRHSWFGFSFLQDTCSYGFTARVLFSNFAVLGAWLFSHKKTLDSLLVPIFFFELGVLRLQNFLLQLFYLCDCVGMASKAKGQTMREDEILADLCADELSDVPVEANEESSESENDSDFPVRSKRRKIHSFIISDSESSENSDDEEIDSEVSNTWKKRDIKVSLEKFEGTPGVQIRPNHFDSISEVVELFLGDDFFQIMCDESNRYYSQNKDKYKLSPKSGKWSDITVPELKKFLSIIILMGQVRKTSLKEYWSTDPFISTPIFQQLMSRNRFEYIWKAWHFNNNDLYSNTTVDRLFKIRPVLDYIVEKFQTVYKPNKNYPYMRQ